MEEALALALLVEEEELVHEVIRIPDFPIFLFNFVDYSHFEVLSILFLTR